MKICVAQTIPVKGDIAANVINHKRLIDIAINKGADMIVFPELSLTGYEPTLAAKLFMVKDDSRLDVLQKVSDENNIIICAGLPTKTTSGYCITMVIFQPGKVRRTYSKKYLHADEEPFFVSGDNFAVLPVNNVNVGLAICYELSAPEHVLNAFKNGAGLYVASVAKSAGGVQKASTILAEIAKDYSALVLMSNSIGPSDDFVGAGGSAIWNKNGGLLCQLNDTDEGIIVIDTVTLETFKETITL